MYSSIAYSTPLLLFLILIVVDTYALDKICDFKRENEVVFLACPKEKEIITKITFSSFGNPQGDCTTENIIKNDECQSVYALDVAEAYCLGRRECRVPAAPSLFGKTENCKFERSLILKAECGFPIPSFSNKLSKDYEINLVIDDVEKTLSFAFDESVSYFDLQNSAENFLKAEFGVSDISVRIVDSVVKQMYLTAYEVMGREVIGNLDLGSPQDGTYCVCVFS